MKVKKGDKVVVVSEDSRVLTAYDKTVKSVGKKWITVGESRWSVNCREGDDDQDEISYGHRYRMFSSREVYERWNERRKAILEFNDIRSASIFRHPIRDDVTIQQIKEATKVLRGILR